MVRPCWWRAAARRLPLRPGPRPDGSDASPPRPASPRPAAAAPARSARRALDLGLHHWTWTNRRRLETRATQNGVAEARARGAVGELHPVPHDAGALAAVPARIVQVSVDPAHQLPAIPRDRYQVAFYQRLVVHADVQ